MREETPDIYLDLQRKLMNRVFVSGAKIKPADLQDTYGCSANTIRENLLRLTNLGLVTFEAQRGFRVAEASQAAFNDITQFRILLEQEGTVQSIRNGGVKWESDLSASHHRLVHIERAISIDGEVESYLALWSEAERDFHETMISGCQSAILRETYGRVYMQFRQQMVNLERNFSTPYFETVTREHQAILDAVLARDEAAARQAIYDHLKRNIRELAEVEAIIA